MRRCKDSPKHTDIRNIIRALDGSKVASVTYLECVVYAIDGVFLHGEQEAGGQLRVGGACIVQCGCGVGEVLTGHQVVRLKCCIKISAVNAW